MKVIDILSTATDYTNIAIYTTAGDIVSWYDGYDGKNSIDEEYNDADVVQITAIDNKLVIYINE